MPGTMEVMTSTALDAPALWAPPPSVRTRGTLALVAGAGESARVYERFGRRLSVDGYLVGVFEAAAADHAAAWLGLQDVSPRVLVGSDAGAAAALRLAVAHAAPADGVILAGLPAGDPRQDVIAEARTSCPVHLGVLASDDAAALTVELPLDIEIPDAATLRALAVPVLAIHGGADAIAPFAEARDVLAALPELELVETVGGLHDALNDQSHRSVAATIVLWLERLRGSAVGSSVVRTVSRSQRATALGGES